MRRDYLIGSTVVSQQNQRIRLEYYLVEELRDASGIYLYGILIKRETKEKGKIERIQAVGKAISYSKEYVEKMIRIFMKNTVTPISMEELIDEYVSQTICV